MSFNFVIFHNRFVNKNEVLKSQIEDQLKPYFYRQIEERSLIEKGLNLTGHKFPSD